MPETTQSPVVDSRSTRAIEDIARRSKEMAHEEFAAEINAKYKAFEAQVEAEYAGRLAERTKFHFKHLCEAAESLLSEPI